MVDPIGIKGATSIDRKPAPVAPAAAVQVSQPAEDTSVTRASSTLQALSQPAAASAPVDAERVSKIKKAIQDGKFPILPSTIADRLLALKLEWNPNEAA
ncbi:flagellar biosynthesis anti-sigma factor FlgM [uncultured Sphingomonas sp.]|uniref:flagellar biosynthesis anti-sigma factor FlgM n=1 Tax=uncultured Sphingomonas sp. TaxID=158754 RepID=UPI0025DCDF83|nr:flagellar biosynthesis anti-sigma factor FlgM [uncultured Sphingomonas sp.]